MSTAEVPAIPPVSLEPRRTPPKIVVESVTGLRGNLPSHKDLPCEDGAMENAFDHPQSALLKESLLPILERRHPDGLFCVVHDTAFYVRHEITGRSIGIVPDWAYVPGLLPTMPDGGIRRSFLAWREPIEPVIAFEYVSFEDGGERDRTPEDGKFWIYEHWLRPGYYGIFDVDVGQLEVHRLVGDRFEQMEPNAAGRYPIEPLGVELGVWRGSFQVMTTFWMRWFDAKGNLLPTDAERADRERELKEKFAAKLRELGHDPDQL
jgi:hypothetical protein